VVNGTPLVQDTHDKVAAEVARIDALRLELTQRKESLVKGNITRLPLPAGVVLAWEEDLPSQFTEWTQGEHEHSFPVRRGYESMQCENCSILYTYKAVRYSDNQIRSIEYHSCPSCGASVPSYRMC
jgi:hypothetical protein